MKRHQRLFSCLLYLALITVGFSNCAKPDSGGASDPGPGPGIVGDTLPSKIRGLFVLKKFRCDGAVHPL